VTAGRSLAEDATDQLLRALADGTAIETTAPLSAYRIIVAFRDRLVHADGHISIRQARVIVEDRAEAVDACRRVSVVRFRMDTRLSRHEYRRFGLTALRAAT
jgi:hypothetical protein